MRKRKVNQLEKHPFHSCIQLHIRIFIQPQSEETLITLAFMSIFIPKFLYIFAYLYPLIRVHIGYHPISIPGRSKVGHCESIDSVYKSIFVSIF